MEISKDHDFDCQWRTFNALRYGCTPVMAAGMIFFVLLAVLIVGFIRRFGDLPRLMGALAVGENKSNFWFYLTV